MHFAAFGRPFFGASAAGAVIFRMIREFGLKNYEAS
jgi:hypothetical protein